MTKPYQLPTTFQRGFDAGSHEAQDRIKELEAQVEALTSELAIAQLAIDIVTKEKT